MANAAKQKGDRGEREAVEVLTSLVPDLVCASPQRMLGAGRRDDIGDLRVFEDVTVQVKTYSNLAEAVRLSIDKAMEQNARAGLRFALGMAPIPRASTAPDAVRWLAACTEWPVPELLGEAAMMETGLISIAVKWLRLTPTKQRPDVLPLDRRVAIISKAGLPDIYLGTIQSWLRAYRVYRGAMTTATSGVPTRAAFAQADNNISTAWEER